MSIQVMRYACSCFNVGGHDVFQSLPVVSKLFELARFWEKNKKKSFEMAYAS